MKSFAPNATQAVKYKRSLLNHTILKGSGFGLVEMSMAGLANTRGTSDSDESSGG